MERLPPSRQSVRMLHLSDFHFTSKTELVASAILRSLCEEVARIQAQGPIDLVLVTGDIAMSGKKSEYELAKAWFLKQLRPKLGEAFPLDHFLFVPGNHDVDVVQENMMFPYLRKDLHNFDENKFSACFVDHEAGGFYKMLRSRHAAYLEFARFFSGNPKEEAWWQRSFQLAGASVGIAGLASSWFCDKSDDKGKIALGLHQLHEVLDPLDGVQLPITLLHHPTDFLIESDQRQANKLIAKRARIALRGHRHVGQALAVRDGSDELLWLAAGSAYGGQRYENGFELLEWSPQSGVLTLTPYVYHQDHLSWILDGNQFPESDDKKQRWTIAKLKAPGPEPLQVPPRPELDPQKLCPGCFVAMAREGACPEAYCHKSGTPPSSYLETGHQLNGRYVLGLPLGEKGRFAQVYLAWDSQEGTRVAIKEFFPSELVTRKQFEVVLIHSNKKAELEKYWGVFLREQEILEKLNHPQVVKKVDFFEENKTAYLVMAYEEGFTLAEWLAEQKYQTEEQWAILCIPALDWMLRLLDGLEEVHSKGYIHRDIKPANIYLAREGRSGYRPILLDFGFSRLVGGDKSRVGTECYAAPEQFMRNAKVDERADLYGVGASLYEILSRNQPPSYYDRMDQDPLKEEWFAPMEGLVEVIHQAMAIRKEERQSGVEELRKELRACLVTNRSGGRLVGAEGEERLKALYEEEKKAREEAEALVDVEKGLRSRVEARARQEEVARKPGRLHYEVIGEPNRSCSR